LKENVSEITANPTARVSVNWLVGRAALENPRRIPVARSTDAVEVDPPFTIDRLTLVAA
jgi:hypothetical protein